MNMGKYAIESVAGSIAEARQVLERTDTFSDRGYLVRLNVAQLQRLLDDIEAMLLKEEAKVPA